MELEKELPEHPTTTQEIPGPSAERNYWKEIEN